MLQLSETASTLVAGNKDAAILSAKIITGNIINDKVASLVAPKLPLMVRAYAQTELGKAAIANLVAGTIIHTLPDNAKALVAAECMIQSASLKLAESFNIQEMVNSLLEGISLPDLSSVDEVSGD